MAHGRQQHKDLPIIRSVSDSDVRENQVRIQKEITDLVDSELMRMLSTPELSHLVVIK